MLAAQIVVQTCLMVVTLALVVAVSIVFFGVSAPMSPAAMVLSIALCMAALFAIGLTIAALARTAGAARGLMAAALYPMMFFSGARTVLGAHTSRAARPSSQTVLKSQR